MPPESSTPLGTVSPSLLSRLACPARVAFGQGGHGPRIDGANVPAIVGSIVHRAMELSINGSTSDGAWETAVEESRARGEHPDEMTALRKARLRYQLRVQEALQLIAEVPASDVYTEVRLVSPDGVLEGTPDLIVVRNGYCVVVDFKTGLVTDVDDPAPRAAYARQIQLYAYLASQHYNAPPSSGVLLSFKEGAIEVDVTPPAIQRAVDEARSQREEFNQRAPGSQPARPGESTCMWCDHQARCDGFWEAISAGEPVGIGRSLTGRIVGVPEVSRNDLTAIKLDIEVGAEVGTTAIIAEIPSHVSNGWSPGDVVGITRLSERPGQDAIFRFSPRSLIHRWTPAE